jgi:hypothetical protein
MPKLCFTIRDMLWMTVVVALLVAVWRERDLLTVEWEMVRAENKALVLNWRKVKEFAARKNRRPPPTSPVQRGAPVIPPQEWPTRSYQGE